MWEGGGKVEVMEEGVGGGGGKVGGCGEVEGRMRREVEVWEVDERMRREVWEVEESGKVEERKKVEVWGGGGEYKGGRRRMWVGV